MNLPDIADLSEEAYPLPEFHGFVLRQVGTVFTIHDTVGVRPCEHDILCADISLKGKVLTTTAHTEELALEASSIIVKIVQAGAL
jgi:hypothetical protein